MNNLKKNFDMIFHSMLKIFVNFHTPKNIGTRFAINISGTIMKNQILMIEVGFIVFPNILLDD